METEEQIIEKIREEAKTANRNNITRTKAYFNFFQEHPEIHWAYLAHFVSRNTGWNMTDLKGDMLPRLLSEEQVEYFFSFLERCNWLIFQNAYPQLLLYAASKQQNQPLFHLLPQFDISIFMQAVWPRFWQYRNSKLLSYALIMNEQQYIEINVLQCPFYQKNVLETLPFKTQSVLHLNHVFFPFFDLKTNKIRLAGAIVRDFREVIERIQVGKRLYALLFQEQNIDAELYQWAKKTEHTGSRVDYWPQLYSTSSKQTLSTAYTFHLAGGNLHEQAAPVYSPTLESVWSDILNHEIPAYQEWFTNIEGVNELIGDENPHPYDLTDEYLFAINKLELAIIAKEKLP